MLVFAASYLAATAALADDGADVLQRVDAVSTQSDDTSMTLDLVIHDGKGNESSRTMKAWQKGNDRRLVKFVSPARVAGVGLLATGEDSIQLFLPSYGRTRRVSGSARGDAFMGTNFSVDDLTRLGFAEEYTAELQAEDDQQWQLKLVPVHPDKHAHAHLEMWVRKADAIFDRLDYVDGKGEVVRRITFDDIRDEGGRPVAHVIEVEDLQTGRRTVATVRDVAFDSGLEDDLFTSRYLMRPTTP